MFFTVAIGSLLARPASTEAVVLRSYLCDEARWQAKAHTFLISV